MVSAFILAAGFGTRLRPLTLDRPKPLVPICGVPLLAYSLVMAREAGCKEVMVNAHYLAEQLVPWRGEHEGVMVHVVVEEEILGTGGGLKNVADQLAHPTLILNGDVLHDVDLQALAKAVPDQGAAMALRTAEPDQDYGVVAADSTQTVVQLVTLANAQPQGHVDTSTHFTGIHALDPSLLHALPDGFSCIVRTAYTDAVPRRQVRAIRHEGFWLDAGNPTAYLDTNMAVLAGQVVTGLNPFERAAIVRSPGHDKGSPDGYTLEGSAWIGPGATIGPGAHLQDCIIGPGARVPKGARWNQVVAWKDTEATAQQLRRAIVHDSGLFVEAS